MRFSLDGSGFVRIVMGFVMVCTEQVPDFRNLMASSFGSFAHVVSYVSEFVRDFLELVTYFLPLVPTSTTHRTAVHKGSHRITVIQFFTGLFVCLGYGFGGRFDYVLGLAPERYRETLCHCHHGEFAMLFSTLVEVVGDIHRRGSQYEEDGGFHSFLHVALSREQARDRRGDGIGGKGRGGGGVI